MNIATGDFILPVDKPEGPTSHDVVAVARRALGTRRIGHTGTLDPFASGLLLLCVGRATRLAEYLSGFDKNYVATARLGTSTDTLDRDGAVVSEGADLTAILQTDVEAALGSFVGAVDQVPPQFSAKKVDGEAMHRKARRGEHVDLPPVSVTIHSADVVSWTSPDLAFSVRCSTGTYIRAIARDLGDTLGTGAHLTELRRTGVGAFDVTGAIGLDDLADEEAVERARISPLDAMAHLRTVTLDADGARRLLQGQRIRVAAATETPEVEDGPEAPVLERVLVAHEGDLLAVADLDDGLIRPRKVFPA